MNRSLRLALFVVVALVQLAVAGGAIVKSELALRTGEAFRFRIQPVDPVDAFRGRYVAIRFAVDRAPVADDLDVKPGKHVYLPIEIDADGYSILGWAKAEKPTSGPYLRLRAGGGLPRRGRESIRLGIDAVPALLHGRGSCAGGRTGRLERPTRPTRGFSRCPGSRWGRGVGGAVHRRCADSPMVG